MANRPVFIPDHNSYVRIIHTEFPYYNGFSRIQKQRSIESLHSSFLESNPTSNILEISSYSTIPLGVSLSAFNLQISLNGGETVPVENVYQAGKIYKEAGPFHDLLYISPKQAKLDPRHNESGSLVGFKLEEQYYSTNPSSLFYTHLYIKAVEQSGYGEQLIQYDSFTDIVFNPKKSINCQAYSAAIYISLKKRYELARAIESPSFLGDILMNVQPPGMTVM